MLNWADPAALLPTWPTCIRSPEPQALAPLTAPPFCRKFCSQAFLDLLLPLPTSHSSGKHGQPPLYPDLGNGPSSLGREDEWL